MGWLAQKMCKHKEVHLRIEQTERLFGGPLRITRIYCALCGKTIIEGDQFSAVKQFILTNATTGQPASHPAS